MTEMPSQRLEELEDLIAKQCNADDVYVHLSYSFSAQRPHNISINIENIKRFSSHLIEYIEYVINHNSELPPINSIYFDVAKSDAYIRIWLKDTRKD